MVRRLSAILAADVVGYSRLMNEDEAGTLAALKACREDVINPQIAAYDGRVVKWMGDGLLADFPSAVQAVLCAVAIQRQFGGRSGDVPAGQRIEFRIGINVGDIIVEGDDIYGDGVNIAARMEAIAEPGGISVSGSVFDHIKNKIELDLEDLGEQQVKNIPEPIHIYRVAPGMMESTADSAVSPSNRASHPTEGSADGGQAGDRPDPSIDIDLSLPDNPSIAVLPFTNMSADAEQEFFSDGITEDIITELSKVSGLLVVARNSTFTYKGKAVDAKRVSHEQGVRYVLEGSVQKAGKRVRVTAQLIDATTGHHIWAERYDRDLEDIFAVQDEITREIVVALDVKLHEGEQARLWASGTKNLEAWECVRLGAADVYGTTMERLLKAKRLFERALELDPNYAMAWVMLSWFHHYESVAAGIGDVERREAGLAAVLDCAEKALKLDPACADAYGQLALCRLEVNAFDEAIDMSERAIAMAPSSADNLCVAAMVLTKSGQPDRGVELIKKALRASPLYRAELLRCLGLAYRLSGQVEAAVSAYKESLRRDSEYLAAHVNLTSSLGELGRVEEAKAAAREIFRLEPNFSIKAYMEGLSYRNPSDLVRIEEGLRKAGLQG
jgi:adenylate cyclase